MCQHVLFISLWGVVKEYSGLCSFINQILTIWNQCEWFVFPFASLPLERAWHISLVYMWPETNDIYRVPLAALCLMSMLTWPSFTTRCRNTFQIYRSMHHLLELEAKWLVCSSGNWSDTLTAEGGHCQCIVLLSLIDRQEQTSF